MAARDTREHLLGDCIMSKRARLAVAIQPIIENLESRRLLATQLVSGTTGDDIIVFAKNGGDPTLLDITINGSTATVPGRSDTIDCQPDIGNDSVTIVSLPAGITKFTLEDTGGSDTVDASGADNTVAETLQPGSGDDTVIGNDGDNAIDGSTGNDSITSGDG